MGTQCCQLCALRAYVAKQPIPPLTEPMEQHVARLHPEDAETNEREIEALTARRAEMLAEAVLSKWVEIGDVRTVCDLCVLRAQVAGERRPRTFAETPEAHSARLHPDRDATQREYAELKATLRARQQAALGTSERLDTALEDEGDTDTHDPDGGHCQ